MLYYEAIQIFYRDCLGRMLSERTIQNYSEYLKGFGMYLQRIGKSNIEEITEADVLDYFAYKRKTCCEGTIKHNFIAIRACFKCLVSRHKKQTRIGTHLRNRRVGWRQDDLPCMGRRDWYEP